jgi:hypothetical protein
MLTGKDIHFSAQREYFKVSLLDKKTRRDKMKAIIIEDETTAVNSLKEVCSKIPLFQLK